MKLATFRSGGVEKIGMVHTNDSALFDLAAAADRGGRGDPAFASMLALIDAGPAALDRARALFDDHGKDDTLSIDVAGAEILAPIPEPRQMRDGMSFPLHILQAPRGQLKLAARAKNDMAELARLDAEPLGELPEIYRKQPIYYITNRFSVRGTNTTVKWPRYSQVMDYELEFGIITKNKGANIPASKAKDDAFIDRDHRRGAIRRRGAADLQFGLSAGRTGDQHRRKRRRGQESGYGLGHGWASPTIFSVAS